MKIKPDKLNYVKLKDKLKQNISKSKEKTVEFLKETNDYIQPKIKKAGVWAGEKIKEAKDSAAPKIKEAVQKAKDTKRIYKNKIKPKVEEYIAYAQYAINPPKIEVLSKKMTNAQKDYLFFNVTFKNLTNHIIPKEHQIEQMHMQLKELEKKAQKATEEYNNFAAQQSAAQKVFDELNGNNI